MSKERYFEGNVINLIEPIEDWDKEHDFGNAPLPWSVYPDGIHDALNRQILKPVITSNTRGHVSANYDMVEAVVNTMNRNGQTVITLQHLQQMIVSWADEVFPDRTPQQAFIKMWEEMGEVVSEPRNHLEWADVFIMMFDLAHHYGISGDDLTFAITEKMEINRGRSWTKNEVGVMQHSETVSIPVKFVDGPCDGETADVDVTILNSDAPRPPNEISLLNDHGIIIIYQLKHDYTVDGRYIYEAKGVIE
jgi:hypothetical protein